MKKSTSKITICIPVYERYDFFEEAIRSAIGQSITCNVIVIDNASSHNRFEKYCQKNLIQYIRNDSNLGMIGNWNECIISAKTEWVSILHDDDVLHPDFISHFLNILELYPEAVGIAAEVTIGKEPSLDSFAIQNISKKIIKFQPDFFLSRNLSPFPGVAFKRESALYLGGFLETAYPISDLDLWYRLLSMGSIYLIDLSLAFYRISKEQSSKEFAEEMLKATYKFKLQIAKNSYEKKCVEQSILSLKTFYEKAYSIKLKIPFDFLTRLKIFFQYWVQKLFKQGTCYI